MPILQMRKLGSTKVKSLTQSTYSEEEAVLGVRGQSLRLSFHAIPSPATWGQHVPALPLTQQQAWEGGQGGWAPGWLVDKILFSQWAVF